MEKRNIDPTFLLNDTEMIHFITHGFHTLHVDLPHPVHQEICYLTDTIFKAAAGNPGNSIYDQIPLLTNIFDHPRVIGALTSLLGPTYRMDCHRHAHKTEPGSPMGSFHQDGSPRQFRGWTRPWRYQHRVRKIVALYFPHPVPAITGPTSIIAGSQYYLKHPIAPESSEHPFIGPAGTLALVHFSLFHRARANLSSKRRLMIKFLFNRTSEPHLPTWNVTPGFNPNFHQLATHLKTHALTRHCALPTAWETIWHWYHGTTSPLDHNNDPAQQLHHLTDPLPAKQIEAAYQLGRCPQALPILLDKLLNSASTERDLVAQALASTPTAVPNLENFLRHNNSPWIRATAADILGDLGHAALTSLPTLIDALDDTDPWVRHNAIQALESLGPKALSAESRVIQALSDPHPFVRFNAISALLNISNDPSMHLPALHRLAQEDQDMQCWKALDSIRQLEHAL